MHNNEENHNCERVMQKKCLNSHCLMSQKRLRGQPTYMHITHCLFQYSTVPDSFLSLGGSSSHIFSSRQ